MYDELARLSKEIQTHVDRCERKITKKVTAEDTNRDLSMIGAEYFANLMELDAYRRCLQIVEDVRQKTLKKED